jgi:hypothetical protein
METFKVPYLTGGFRKPCAGGLDLWRPCVGGHIDIWKPGVQEAM